MAGSVAEAVFSRLSSLLSVSVMNPLLLPATTTALTPAGAKAILRSPTRAKALIAFRRPGWQGDGDAQRIPTSRRNGHGAELAIARHRRRSGQSGPPTAQVDSWSASSVAVAVTPASAESSKVSGDTSLQRSAAASAETGPDSQKQTSTTASSALNCGFTALADTPKALASRGTKVCTVLGLEVMPLEMFVAIVLKFTSWLTSLLNGSEEPAGASRFGAAPLRLLPSCSKMLLKSAEVSRLKSSNGANAALSDIVGAVPLNTSLELTVIVGLPGCRP